MKLHLDETVLKRRVFNQQILDLHINEFMLGQTKAFLSKDKNTIDVGAATGMYTSYFAQKSKHVFSFEAVLPVYKQLEKIKEQYDNITTYNKAVSDHNGISEFYVDDKRLSNSGFQNLVNGQKVIVETITLDSLNIDNVGFLKIDVEGNELDVLHGAQNLIQDFAPTCMVEIHAEFNKYPINTTFEFFLSKGYTCFYNERAKGLVKVNSIDEGIKAAKMPEITDYDFLFTKNSIAK